MKISGVYAIECSASGKYYIGSSAHIAARWSSHKSQLRLGRHSNKHLQNAWNCYGETSFRFTILEVCAPELVVDREQAWMDVLSPSNPAVGMNNSPTAVTTVGFRHSEETRAKLKRLAAARDHAHLRKNAAEMRGKPAPNRGKPGKKWTEEQRAAASAQRRGRKPWNIGIPKPEGEKAIIARSVSIKKTKYTDAYEEITKLRSAGRSWPQISQQLGISISQCHKIGTGKRQWDKIAGTMSLGEQPAPARSSAPGGSRK